MNLKKLFLAGLLLLVVIACTNQQENENLSFKIDKEKIGKVLAFDSLAFSFSPPAGCIAFENELKQKFLKKNYDFKTVSDSNLIIIHYLGYDSLYNSFCTLSQIKPADNNYTLKSIVSLTQRSK